MQSQKSGLEDLLTAPPIIVASFDPGLATGYAVLQRDIEKDTYAPIDFGDYRGLDALQDGLLSFPHKPDLVIYEDFRLFKWKALQQSGSKMDATRAIGAITFWARSKGLESIAQPANILPIAQMWSKIKMPSNHDKSHHISAINHAVYFLVKNGLMSPVGM